MATLVKLRELTPDERRELERLARSRTEEARLVVRAKIVLGLAAGERPYRVAERVGVGRATAYEWLHRFNAEGLKGLTDHPRPGRPQWCWAHLKRDIQALIDDPCHTRKRLGHGLMRQTRKLFDLWKRVRDGTISRCAEQPRVCLVPSIRPRR
jgi:hypothetical protein